MKNLEDYSLQEYNKIKDSGIMWVYYPHATGCASRDLQAVCVKSEAVCPSVSSDIVGYDGLRKVVIGSVLTSTGISKHYYDIIDEDAVYD